MTTQFKIFVCPDAKTGVEQLMAVLPTYADTVATISTVAEGAVKTLLDNGVADMEVTPIFSEPGECFAVGFEWLYPWCENHTHEAYITGRLVMSDAEV